MKLRSFSAAIMLAAAATVSTAAHATSYLVNFTVKSDVWGGYGMPFGVSQDQILTGSFIADSSQTGSARITNLTYTTGSRTWTTADVATNSTVQIDANGLSFFEIYFNAQNYFAADNNAVINDGSANRYCNFCVSYTASVVTDAVPEPATWAMMISGFAVVGASMRRRKVQLGFA